MIIMIIQSEIFYFSVVSSLSPSCGGRLRSLHQIVEHVELERLR